MNDESELEARLREALDEHSRRAPSGAGLPERILAAAQHRSPQRRGRAWGWRGVSLPLVAAASVIAVVAAVLVGTGFWDGPTGGGQPAAPGHSGTVHVASPPPSTLRSPDAATTTPPGTPQQSSSVPGDTSGLVGFRVVDMTFVAGGRHGWALGTATCLDGAPGRCTALVRTTDGGQSWHGMSPPPVNVADGGGCTERCVAHIRFANDDVGYAYGADVVFMTTDAGAHWTRLRVPGPLALEVADGSLVAVSAKCAPGCPYQVWTSRVGAPTWRAARQIPAGMSPGVGLARSGATVALAVYGHTAGGAQAAPTTLWVSSDDGRHWSNRGEPCPRNLPSAGETDTTRVAVGQDGSVTALCTPRQAGAGSQLVLTSTDSARTFDRWNVQPLGRAPATALAGGSATSILLGLGNATYRSTDGRRFVKLSAADGPGAVSWLGFEDTHDARAVSADGRTIWTTHDAGATWSSYTFR